MLIKFIIKLYTNHNTFLVKHATYQKAESVRGASLSKLDNVVYNNSVFNTKSPTFSTCAYNHPYNLHQKSVTPLQLFFTYLFGPYLLIKSTLQSPLTLPFSIPKQFFASLFLRTIYIKSIFPTIYIKSIFPTSVI